MTEQEAAGVIEHLVKNNSLQYNHLKAIEELIELTEVLIKKVNKMGSSKEPDNQEIIDELGDVTIRIAVLNILYGSDKVEARIDEKLSNIANNIKEGKHEGKL